MQNMSQIKDFINLNKWWWWWQSLCIWNSTFWPYAQWSSVFDLNILIAFFLKWSFSFSSFACLSWAFFVDFFSNNRKSMQIVASNCFGLECSSLVHFSPVFPLHRPSRLSSCYPSPPFLLYLLTTCFTLNSPFLSKEDRESLLVYIFLTLHPMLRAKCQQNSSDFNFQIHQNPGHSSQPFIKCGNFP